MASCTFFASASVSSRYRPDLAYALSHNASSSSRVDSRSNPAIDSPTKSYFSQSSLPSRSPSSSSSSLRSKSKLHDSSSLSRSMSILDFKWYPNIITQAALESNSSLLDFVGPDFNLYCYTYLCSTDLDYSEASRSSEDSM